MSAVRRNRVAAGAWAGEICSTAREVTTHPVGHDDT
jgi:hypothetical protein